MTPNKANNFQSKMANYILLALRNLLKRSEIYSNRWIYGIDVFLSIFNALQLPLRRSSVDLPPKVPLASISSSIPFRSESKPFYAGTSSVVWICRYSSHFFSLDPRLLNLGHVAPEGACGSHGS